MVENDLNNNSGADTQPNTNPAAPINNNSANINLENYQGLNTFFDVTEKYYYISKVEELKAIVDTLQKYFSSPEKIKHLKQQFPQKFKNLSKVEIENIQSLLSIISSLLSDFIKVASYLSTEEIKVFYDEIVLLINKVVIKR